MKVILLRDVARVGRKHEVKEVADGFAQNSLFPRGLAQLATPGNLERIAALKKKDVANRAEAEAAIARLKDSFANKPLSLACAANAQGHLFQAVRPSDIAPLLASRGLTVSEKSIIVPRPIKDVGEHSFSLSLEGVEVTFTIVITAQA